MPSTAETEAAARTLWCRLAGCRYELERAAEEKDAVGEPLLGQHLQGALLDVEASLQLVERVTASAACTSP